MKPAYKVFSDVHDCLIMTKYFPPNMSPVFSYLYFIYW